MPKINIKTPSGSTSSIDLDKIFVGDTDQRITGIKSFNDRIDIGGGSIYAIKYANYGDTTGETEYDQIVLSSQGVNGWYESGAKIALHSAYEPGGWALIASNNSNHLQLSGYPDGVLHVSGVSNSSYSYNVNIEKYFLSGFDTSIGQECVYDDGFFIRYASGIQICNGLVHTGGGDSGNPNVGRVVFPLPFKATPRIFGNVTGDHDSDSSFIVRTDGATEFTFLIVGKDLTYLSGWYANYLAIGMWK